MTRGAGLLLFHVFLSLVSHALTASVGYGKQSPIVDTPSMSKLPSNRNKRFYDELGKKIANLDEHDFDRFVLGAFDILNRPCKIAFSDLVESVRLIPADPWQLLGGPWMVRDSAVCEWFWSNPAWEPMTQAGPECERLLVPQQIHSFHRAVKQCPAGGVVQVSEGLYRWDGSIKIRSGLKLESLDGGVHVVGQESPVLMGQWQFAQGSAGSLRSVGLAANLSHESESLLDIRAGPWRFQWCECRSVKGEVVNVCCFGEADFKECTLAGMGAEENLRASMGAFVTDWGNVRFELCSFSSFGLLDIGLGDENNNAEKTPKSEQSTEEKDKDEEDDEDEEEDESEDEEESLGDAEEENLQSNDDQRIGATDRLKLGFGLFIDGDGHVHCVNSSFSDCHVGIVLMANSSAVIAQSTFLKDVSFGAFYADEHSNSTLCIMNCRGYGQTWAGPERPKHLNDYLFEGFKIVVSPFVPANDEERMEYYRMEQEVERSKGKFRNTFDRDKLVQADPSLFPCSDEHKYVYDVREAAPINTELYPISKDGLLALPQRFYFLSKKPIALTDDPRKFRHPNPDEFCYNCGRKDHLMMWCPEGQRPIEHRAVPVVDPCLAEACGITAELRKRQKQRAWRRRKYMANGRQVERLVKDIHLHPEIVKLNGNISQDGRLPKVRENKLNGNIEWYNTTSKKWKSLQVPWLGLPVQTGLVLENGHEYLSKADIVHLNLLRRKDGLKALTDEEWQTEYPRLREIYKEHSDSEDDFRLLFPKEFFNKSSWDQLPVFYDQVINGRFGA
uniref:CCHC-type domain-containing protein n=1 Tax=Guillardia theta TaxID=55529 RepID=A0A7S4P3T8_GUITH|mmetsp:Transcript_42667/g.134380  ORF Transcript_42667/g.134380 Transcript_42667/m.134380 type:complete len:786 (+) Transcript_42667:218-2575(+)